jgi:hypothetical protein
MLDGDIEQAAMFETRNARVFRSGDAQRSIERLAQSRVVTLYLLNRGPIVWLITRQAPVDRIDAEGKELIESGVERHKPEWSEEKIPVECFEMAQVKNDTVAFGDRAVVECF